MKFLKTGKKDAEKTRIKCLELGILNKEYKIITGEEFVYFPISKEVKGLGKIVNKQGRKFNRIPKDIKQALEKKLSKKEIEKIITSYDLIGEIAIIEIPEGMEKKEKVIAQAIFEVHPNIKTVVKKTGAVSGTYRTRKVKVIAGKRTKETIHKEHDCRIKLNVEDVYYSIRLSGERGRIKNLVKKNEKILALFAGVGPFPLAISKVQKDCEIVAIELNKKAVKYMKENIKLNKVKNIKAVLGDVQKVVPKKYKNWADRALMPIPMSGEKFLPPVMQGVKDGGIIHFYSFVDAKNAIGNGKKMIYNSAKKMGFKVKIKRAKILRSYSPDIVQVVIDFIIRK